MNRGSPRLVCSGAAAALAALWLSACAVPLAPGYAVEKESIEVRYVPGSPPHLAVRAAYQLRNVGNAPVDSVDVRFLNKDLLGRRNLRVILDGRELTPPPLRLDMNNGDESLAVAFNPPWPEKQRKQLAIEYDLTEVLASNGFYLAAENWFPALRPPKNLLAHQDGRPDPTEVSVIVPSDFVVLNSGAVQGKHRRNDDVELRFRLHKNDPGPFIVAGRYKEQKVKTLDGTVFFWTFQDLPPDQVQFAGRRLAKAVALLNTDFGRANSNKPSQFWVATMPTDEPVFLAFPSGMLVHQKQLDKGVASDPVMESMVQSLANELFTQVVRPQPDADLLRYGLFAYATEAIHENYKGDAIRRETILQLLHQYDDARAQAVEKPPLRWALSDSAPQEFMVYGKVSLFLFALEDQYGRENVRRGIKFMVQSLRGGQYDYNDFRAALESTTGKDLAGFFRTWLDEKGIPADFRERYEAPMEKK